ncbi:PREDICTED: uncharacterized protein LOC106748475 [Dinoponera quadriceps]|uniref:Uncharacterized protein LOC106748475 n=1 Tax=Dinoponera quadriceps TaxID=609295 RepID=A0A6P3XX02_DINQU|nr:PREDICTED: uncharacterized protein LOC106748475 [Dinoponera quadriceps]XP_014482500.1 PREDICTED: uncharacterized protein LOC106748475 [Dinoponera quadriceps]
MSLLLGTAESLYLNETKDLFLPKDENDDYDFKYIPANHFKYIVKDVRRQRCREEEENVWASFVKQQELSTMAYNKNGIQPSIQSIKELLDEGIKEADKELKRLETDILSDEIKQEHSGRTENRQRKRSEVNNIRNQSSKKVPITRDTGTGSTNLLLAIPEEENTSAYRGRQEAGNFKSYTKKSCSGHAVARKRQQSSKRLIHATNGIEYNSSPESSSRRDDANGVIYTRPDPFIMHKILTMQRKVCELLDEIALRLGNIPVPDGIKDLQRRQQCVAEFVVRFSRNYLYDLNRYVKDIQRHMCIISPRARVKPNQRSLGLHMHAIEHKLLAAHQLLLHALVAYCKHIPSSILKGNPGRFREILQVVIDLKTMCDRLHLNTNYLDAGDTDILILGKDIESKCNVILSKLKLHSDNDLLDSNKTSSMASFTSHSANNKKRINRKQLPNRLSMYSADTKAPKSNLKQRNYYRQKDKKYNRVDDKRVSNEPVSAGQPYPSSVTLVPNENANQSRIRRHRAYAKEEDIKTMMDMMLLADSDNGSNLELQEGQDNAMLTRRQPKALRKFPDKLQCTEHSETIEHIVKTTSTNNDDELVKRVTMITEEHLSNLVPVIADFMSFVSNKQSGSEARPVSAASTKTLMEFLQRYQSPKSANTKTSVATGCDACHSPMVSSCECENIKTNRATNETQKSGRNMRLICLSSMDDASKEPRDTLCQDNCESSKELPDFETKMMEATRTRVTDTSFSNIELVVSEETETNFLKYKREYQRLMQSIPMYSSNTQNKPWDIVAWISDKLVDELITEIAKELEMDDVIQKLFELEFQEF